MENAMIECVGLQKTFRQRVVPVERLQDRLLRRMHRKHVMELHAVHNVSLTVERGEWVGIYGKNGSGKSTLLKLIAGLLVPDTGSVLVRGSVSGFFDLGIGFHPERTARENIRIHGLMQGMNTREIEKSMKDIIAFADIGEHAILPMKCLSTGMSMRLAFAAAASLESDVYLFDEVLAVGDAAFQERCKEYFKNLRMRGKTVMIVSHDEEELLRLTDRVLRIDAGVIQGSLEGGHGEGSAVENTGIRTG